MPIAKIPHPRVILLGLLGAAGVFSGCAARSGAEPAPSVTMVGVQQTLDRALRRPDEWFKTNEGRRLADILVSWQNPDGGWWKKYDPTVPRPADLPPPDAHDGPPGDTEDVWRPTSTFDNGATYTEMRILAKAYNATGEERYRASFLRGLNFIFASQYPIGGWPQRFPLQDNYGRLVTFNDNAMINVMSLLRDIGGNDPAFAFVPEPARQKCRESLARGIDCVLACQIRTGGRLTGWCQQYDPVTLAPALGRTYELPGIAAAETAGIVLFLMELPEPDERVRRSVEAVVRWFEDSKITGKRLITVTGPQYENGRDRLLVDDPAAPPIWARLHEIETNKPMFSSRDGVKRDSIAEISHERRNNYGWFGNWGARVEEAYVNWKKRVVNHRGSP